MNSIGFDNFRRFQYFPEIDLGDITILVGGNNAGKSTLVKAILLMRDFLKRRIERVENLNKKIFWKYTPQFSFDTEHVNIGDFYRAFCRQSPSKDDTITFYMRIDKFRFQVRVRGERKPGIIPRVSMIAVADDERDINFEFDFSKGQMTIRFEYDREALNSNINDKSWITSKIKELKKQLSKSKDLNEVSNIKIELENLERMSLYAYGDGTEVSEYDEVTIDLSYFKGDHIGNLVIPELIKSFVYFSDSGTIGDKRSAIYKDKVAKKSFLRGKATVINEIANELEKVLNGQVFEYIYAHSVYQDSVYSNCANSSDYTKRTVHEFYTSRISKGDEEFSLIEKWLKEFKIGESLKAISYKGDNYSLVIFDEENPELLNEKEKDYPGGIDLADKGMGSIQIVTMLLRIATLIRKYKGQHLTILLEEPEQNLHPAIQSKLAEMVYEVNIRFGIRFVIETHSEYLIRRTQVMVAGFDFKDETTLNNENPFAVYFLNKNPEEEPTQMTYKLSGAFNEKFGEGFYDEASKWDMMIIRKEFEQRKKK